MKKHYRKIMCIIVLLAALGLMIVSCDVNEITDMVKPQNMGNTISNLKNLGWISQDDKNLYYKLLDNGKPYIYKSDLYGGNKVKLAQVNSINLNVIDGWIYYINCDDEYKIYKMDIYGQHNQKISDINVLFLLAYENKLYVISVADNYNNHLYSMDFDGDNIIQLSDDKVRSLDLYNEKLYYVSRSPDNTNDILYVINLDGSHKEKVFEYTEISWFCIYNNYIYHNIQLGVIEKTNLSNGEKVASYRPPQKAFAIISCNLSGNLLYYFDGMNSSLHILNLDNDEEKVVNQVDYNGIYILNNKIYHYKNDQLFQADLNGSNDKPF